jgi:hypothetical protein
MEHNQLTALHMWISLSDTPISRSGNPDITIADTPRFNATPPCDGKFNARTKTGHIFQSFSIRPGFQTVLTLVISSMNSDDVHV